MLSSSEHRDNQTSTYSHPQARAALDGQSPSAGDRPPVTHPRREGWESAVSGGSVLQEKERKDEFHRFTNQPSLIPWVRAQQTQKVTPVRVPLSKETAGLVQGYWLQLPSTPSCSLFHLLSLCLSPSHLALGALFTELLLPHGAGPLTGIQIP